MNSNVNALRLAELTKALKSFDNAKKTFDPSAAQQALMSYQELSPEINAAYGPTLSYMKGMDEYSRKYS
jgi:hypothetical protein